MRKKLIFFIMPIILFCVILNFYLFYIILNKYNLYTYVSDTLQFRFDFIQYAIAGIFFTFIFTCIMVIFKLNFIINPIKKLTNTATKIALGQYEKRIEFYEADEIGQLSHSFNLMASRLEETIKDLNDKKNKLYSILNSMDDGVIFVDTEKNIVLINPAAKEIFNVKGETKNRYILEVIRDSRIDELINNPDETPVEIIMHGEKERILQVKSISVSDYGTGNIIGVLLVIHDVTKIKALENMRSEFVANVSHELKTPLTSIKGFAETLKYVEDKETRDKFLDIIYVESERLSRLINDILTLSELENKDYAINFQKVCLNECITEVYYIMERISLEKNIRLSIDSCEEQLYIYGDRDKFKQMIINLVDNAIKYTPQNGEVYLKLEKYNNNARIEVRDTGIGISKKHLPRLFERFYRVDKARSRSMGGTGLGLAIVKHIVLMFKGDIYVDSEVNKGTTFTIILPLFENK
ncbi:two-component system histidine kinase PnpS [Caloramator proteoclasticus]|uniref:two-component system histidine kinase PnpS n=1 Tax=Caloramator proteoclasticus TaxID=53342 RepID=UPI0009333D8E|nr:phosphate regulon sensor histidine kinase PhoR [Caloramator proteoclasticus]